MSHQTPSSAATAPGDKLDEPSTDTHQELLTEHFGFNPRVFIDALVYAANEHLYSIGAQFEDYAKQQLKKSASRRAKEDGGHSGGIAAAEAEAERGVHAILTLLENALDHTFDLLELYCLKMVFGIRPSEAKRVTLSHHRGLDLRTAEERAKDEAGSELSARKESMQLQEREVQLQNRLARARGVRHALRLANVVAKQRFSKAQNLSNIFSVLLVRQDGSAQLPSVLPQSARKLSADASSLLRAMEVLVGTDSLGSSLLAAPGQGPNERERKHVMEESGASEEERRAWERGREGYINWEIERIVKSVHDRRRSDVGNQTLPSTPGGPKRRRTEEGIGPQRAIVGDTAELEELAQRMQSKA